MGEKTISRLALRVKEKCQLWRETRYDNHLSGGKWNGLEKERWDDLKKAWDKYQAAVSKPIVIRRKKQTMVCECGNAPTYRGQVWCTECHTEFK